jgi:hypothetical protein
MADRIDTFAEAESRQKRLLAQLAASPVSDVFGVVAPSGAGGGRSRGEDLWTLLFTLDAWRIKGTDLQTRPLTVRRKLTDEELHRLRDQIAPYTVIRIKARVVAESVLGSPQALLEAFVGVDTSDTALNDHTEQLQRAVTFEDPVFGTFTLDRRIDWFTAEVVWDGRPVSLNLSAREPAEVQRALKATRALWQSQSVWNRRIRDYAVQELLPLKNESWLDEDEAELTPDEFQDRMTLESVTVNPNGSFDFWHNDGDLFWGHSIQICGSISEGPTHADIPG